MLEIKSILIVAYFGVFCMGIERAGWPGYEYEADIGGWLKVHLEPADWSTARATCHSEGALLASPWSGAFTSTVTRIQASKSIPMMYSGAGLRSGYDFHSETGNCYKLHKDPQYMADAISTCHSEGGYLAKLDGGDSEMKKVLGVLSKIASDAWEPITYIANDNGGSKYRHMYATSFNDYSCDLQHPFICEKPATNTGTDLRD